MIPPAPMKTGLILTFLHGIILLFSPVFTPREEDSHLADILNPGAIQGEKAHS